jgi:hypothetical protein
MSRPAGRALAEQQRPAIRSQHQKSSATCTLAGMIKRKQVAMHRAIDLTRHQLFLDTSLPGPMQLPLPAILKIQTD